MSEIRYGIQYDIQYLVFSATTNERCSYLISSSIEIQTSDVVCFQRLVCIVNTLAKRH